MISSSDTDMQMTHHLQAYSVLHTVSPAIGMPIHHHAIKPGCPCCRGQTGLACQTSRSLWHPAGRAAQMLLPPITCGLHMLLTVHSTLTIELTPPGMAYCSSPVLHCNCCLLTDTVNKSACPNLACQPDYKPCSFYTCKPLSQKLCQFPTPCDKLLVTFYCIRHNNFRKLEVVFHRIFQQQFCQIGKPVLVRGIRPGFLWDPDTMQRATVDLKGMYGNRPDKSAPRVQAKAPRPLTVSNPPHILHMLVGLPIRSSLSVTKEMMAQSGNCVSPCLLSPGEPLPVLC